MEVIKWFGYIVAASVVLSVVVGIGGAIFVVTAVGGALVCTFILLGLIATIIKEAFEDNSSADE